MTDMHVIEEEAGTITVSPSVLSTVVVRSAEEVDGARVRRSKRPRRPSLLTGSQAMPQRRGLDIEVIDGRAHVSLELAARYGVVLPELAEEVQRRVADGLASMCGLRASAVDVSIEELEDA